MQRRHFLLTSSQALGAVPLLGALPAGTLLAPEPEVAGFVLRAGQSRFGIPTPFRGLNPNDVKVSTRDTSGGVAMFEYTGVEKTGPPRHLHLAQEELFYVGTGEFLFQLGEQKVLLRAGDTIFLPRQVPHTWVQRSEGQGRLLYWGLPAGQLEAFFGFLSKQPAPLPAAAMTRVHAHHGMQLLGPGLSATQPYAVSPRLTAGFRVAPGTDRLGEPTRLGEHNRNDLKVAGRDTGGLLSLFEYTGQGPGGPPLHRHLHQDEVFYVLSGTYRFRVGAAEHELTGGDLIFLPRNVPHTFAQLSEAGKLLYFFTPAGRMEDFFRAAAAFPAHATPAQEDQLWTDHGMQVVGPPLQVDR